MILVEVLSDLASVLALVPEWRELLAASAADSVTLSPQWLLTWWDVFGAWGSRRLRFLAVRDGGQLVGLAPLLTRRVWQAPGVPFRRLEPLASGERESDAICSDYLNVIARRGREAEVASAVVAALSDWDELILPLMDGDGPMPSLLAEAARKSGLLASITETTRAPYLALPPTWEAFLKQLGKKERYLVNRTLRDFEAWAAGEWRLHEATADNLADAKRILHSLHGERWAGGVFCSPLFQAFHDRAMPLLLSTESLELLWLTVRAKPVASMYNLRWGEKVSFYQCGRSLEVPDGVRPGGVMLYLAIRRAIEAGRREFDFLGGDALYKRQLTTTSRPLVRLRLARRSLKEGARALAERGKDALRTMRNRLRVRPSVENDH